MFKWEKKDWNEDEKKGRETEKIQNTNSTNLKIEITFIGMWYTIHSKHS